MFVKFGGSVITDKTGQEAPDLPLIGQLAAEVGAALAACQDAGTPLQLVLGHGSGSFGHTYARRYNVHRGVPPGGDWHGFAYTAGAALRLNRIVVDALLAAGVPALSLQPSTTLRSSGGTLQSWDTATVALALKRGLVPVVHGDVAFDDAQGAAIISTEHLLVALAGEAALRPDRVILVGESGVYTADPRSDPAAKRIPHIDGNNIASVLQGTGDSHGVDVTGGMRAKVELMWRLVSEHPGMTVQLIGTAPGLLQRALCDQAAGEGTSISR